MQIHVHVIVVLSRLVVVKQECFSLGFFVLVCVCVCAKFKFHVADKHLI